MDLLVVGLGNPGREYENTKHNIAWMLLDSFFQLNDISPRWKEKFKGEFQLEEIDGQKIAFLKPKTYMNLSGESVLPLSQFYKVSAENILVIHDEIDFPYGVVGFKKGGGFAGHNGLKSVSQCLGTANFQRYRLGVGRPRYGDVSSWVLSDFKGDEKIALESYLKEASRALRFFFKHGQAKASNKYNKKELIQ